MIILERFEENIAVLEKDDEFLHVNRELIAPEAREGDILTEKDGRYYPDKNETEKRRKKITELQNSLWG